MIDEKKKPIASKPLGLFGEVLFDQFPDGQQILGGAPFNVAWHLQAFGAQPHFISRIGNDAQGDAIRRTMTVWGMATDNLQTDSDYPTGAVAVTLNNSEPEYAILDRQAYDFIAPLQPEQPDPFSIIYHGTLTLRNPVSKRSLDTLLANHTGKVFVDVNLRAPWWNPESVKQSLYRADWVKLNDLELMQLSPHRLNQQQAMRRLQSEYQLDTLIVTCGNRGALTLDGTGELLMVEPTGELDIVDTVGAGDAFAAIMLLGMQRDWPLPVTLERAQTFASALVCRRGATVQDLRFYQAFIDSWHLDQANDKIF